MKKIIFLSAVLFQGFAFSAPSPCNINNYEDFIYDSRKINQLIEETGWGCDLGFGSFEGIDFRGADLRFAKLNSAKFINCDLRGANLGGAIFINAIFTGSIYNKGTNFPGIDRIFNPKKREMTYYEPTTQL